MHEYHKLLIDAARAPHIRRTACDLFNNFHIIYLLPYSRFTDRLAGLVFASACTFRTYVADRFVSARPLLSEYGFLCAINISIATIVLVNESFCYNCFYCYCSRFSYCCCCCFYNHLLGVGVLVTNGCRRFWHENDKACARIHHLINAMRKPIHLE